MALIDCVECNNKVSEMAKSCPSCGIPIKKSSFESASDLSHLSTIFKTDFWWSAEGRISRSQYIIGSIILFFIFGSIVFIIDFLSEKLISSSCGEYGYYSYDIIEESKKKYYFNEKIESNNRFSTFFINILVLNVKRFKDFGKSGSYIFGLALPIVGFYFLWLLLSRKSDDGKNIYGNSPKF